MKWLLGILFLLFYSISLGQKSISNAEIEKMMKKAQKMAEQVKKDPRFSETQKKEEIKDNPVKHFPKISNSLLALIPKQRLSKPELKEYLIKLYNSFSLKISNEITKKVNQINESFSVNTNKMEIAAISNWYHGAYQKAILFAVNACSKNPNDKLNLNNLAAFLNMGGVEYLALPILRTLSGELPDNAIVLNNIGQCFAGLGELDSAKFYLGRCIKIAPYHPEANNTLGQIESVQGNYIEAKMYFKNCLKGGYNTEADSKLHMIDPDVKVSELIKPRTKFPPYFNEYKYKLPRQCTDINDSKIVEQEHRDFYEFMQNISGQYSELRNAEEQMGNSILNSKTKELISNPMLFNQNALVGPFTKSGMKILGDLMMEYPSKKEDLNRYISTRENDIQNIKDNYEKNKINIINEYQEKMKKIPCGEGNGKGCALIDELMKEQCKAVDKLSNECLKNIAMVRKDIEEKQLLYERNLFENVGYYSYLAAPEKHMANAAFYGACDQYLTALKSISQKYFTLNSACNYINDAESKIENDKEAKFECPFDLEIPFIVGKLKLNCEKFTFSAGEGVEFSYEKDFESHQSTISIGIGLSAEFGEGSGPLSGNISSSINESFFIAFDENNSISDAGLEFNLAAKASAESSLHVGGVGISRDQGSEGVDLGYKIGINSGWTFNDGCLKNISSSLGSFFRK